MRLTMSVRVYSHRRHRWCYSECWYFSSCGNRWSCFAVVVNRFTFVIWWYLFVPSGVVERFSRRVVLMSYIFFRFVQSYTYQLFEVIVASNVFLFVGSCFITFLWCFFIVTFHLVRGIHIEASFRCSWVVPVKIDCNMIFTPLRVH